MLTITRAGLSAIAQADINGFKISLTSFKLSQHQYSAGLNLIEATDLFGVPVHSGPITLVEIVGTSTIKITIEIPRELPRTGVWHLKEIGLYLDTGELFALGALEPTYEKDNKFGIKLYIVVAANRLGEIASVNVGNSNSLPVVSAIRRLPAPIDSDHSVVAALDGITNPYGSPSSNLAVRSGPGLTHWSFVGHTRIYHSKPTLVPDIGLNKSTFVTTPEEGGFWLNNNEIVIAQITSGLGSGESRRMKYSASTSTFTVIDAPFSGINDTSTVAIWRSDANQLPARVPSIPEYMVLGHGLNSWRRVDPIPSTFYTYEAVYCYGTLNESSQFGNFKIEPQSADVLAFVYAGGQLIPEGQFSLSWNIATVFGRGAGTPIDILLFKRVVSTTGAGGLLTSYEAGSFGDGQTKRFHFSIVPKSTDWVCVFIDDLFIPKSAYAFYETSVVLHAAPVDGARVKILQFSTQDDTSGSCNTYRTFRQLSPGDTEVHLPYPIRDKSASVVFIDNKYYAKTKYETLTNILKILEPPTFPGGASYIDIYTFVPDALETDTPVSFSGTNSGPQWVDPAGLEGPPNRLVPKTISVLSDGAKTSYEVPTVPNADHVLVFIGGQFKQRETYTYSQGQVVLNTPAPNGTMVDFVCFTEDTSLGGFEVLCTTFNVQTSSDTFYQLAPVTDPEYVIVTVGGEYQHKRSYTIDPQSRIFFQGVMPNERMEVWYFNNQPRAGWRTTLRYDKSGGAALNSYPLSQLTSRKENILVFADTDKRDLNLYEINSAGDRVTLNPNVLVNTPVVNVSFVSGVPKTRLLTREEYNRSVVSFNYRTGAVLLTREDVRAVLQREDIFALLTDSERAILAGGGGGGGGGTEPPSAEPGNTFVTTFWIVPDGVYRIRSVIIGGGGGGGGGSNDFSHAGHGGRRGEVLIREFDVVPGQALEVRLGVGGSPYLYTQDGTIVYPQPGDYGTSDGMRAYPGRDGGDTIFHEWVAFGGRGGGVDPAYAPFYKHADADGEGQVAPAVGTGAYSGGGMGGTTGIATVNNDTMTYSYPGTNGAFGWSVPNSTGGGYSATAPGAGGGGAAADPSGVGAFGGSGRNGIVYISWGNL